MTPAELNKAVESGRIPPLIFLYGDEPFLVDQAWQRIVARAVAPEARDFNLQVFNGRDLKPEEVLDSCRTFPVFAPQRVVSVKDAGQLDADSLSRFISYLRDPLPETILLFQGEKIDGRLAFFKEFKKRGTLVEFKRLRGEQVANFVKNHARSVDKNFTEEALALFCRRVDGSLGEIQAELNKLCTYAGDKPLIDVDDVEKVVTDTRNENIFDLVNAIGRRRPSEALGILDRMIQDGEPPLRILAMIVRHFRMIWQAAEMDRLGMSRREMASRLKINPYFVEGLIGQGRRFSRSEYRQAFVRFQETDLALKSSGAHPFAIMEQLLMSLAVRSGEDGE
ncbi:MAG: DNA polymerase III subunit delta [Geoalkalibacter sp.]|uniref:DNA polymerase III subunit delta n=1 Tax=Geoalkalibacter sp. TaxID=3041440 RepID=UPI003D0DA221